jgi:hypothetical protein
MPNKKYIVSVKEVFEQDYIVEAENVEEALDKVEDGDGELLEDTFEYDKTLEKEHWKIEEVV